MKSGFRKNPLISTFIGHYCKDLTTGTYSVIHNTGMLARVYLPNFTIAMDYLNVHTQNHTFQLEGQ